MTYTIARAVVIGSGTMGGGIAAHFANAGIPVYLLDITQQIVKASLDRLKKNTPPAFVTPQTAELVTIGSLDQNEAWIGEGDWIIEAIVENLDAKRELVARIDRLRKPGSIVSSNTSGIADRADRRRSVRRIQGALPRHALLQSAALHEAARGHSRRRTRCRKSRPSCASSRRRASASRSCSARTRRTSSPTAWPRSAARRSSISRSANDYTVEETDAIAGPLIGRPKTAAFRLQDLVGFDVSSAVASESLSADRGRRVARGAALAARGGAAQEPDGEGPPRRQDQAGLLQEGRQDHPVARSGDRRVSRAHRAGHSRRSPRPRRSAACPSA